MDIKTIIKRSSLTIVASIIIISSFMILTMGFSDLLMISTIIASIGCFFLGVYALKFNPHKRVNQFFAFFCFMVTAWLVTDYWSLITYNLFDIRIAMVAASFKVLALFLFAYSFTYKKLNHKIIVLVATLAVINVIIATSPYLFPSLSVINGIPHPTVGIGMLIFAPYAIIVVIGSLILLIKNLRCEDPLKRTQAQFIVTGLVITMMMILFFNFYAVNIWKTSQYIPIGMMSVLVFVGLTTYAVTRYRFLNIKLILRRNVISVGLCFAFIGTLFIISSNLNTVHRWNVSISRVWYMFVLAAFFAIIFKPLNNVISHFVQKIIKRQNIDLHKWTDDELLIMHKSLNPEGYARLIAAKFQKRLPVENFTFIIFDHYEGCFKTIYPSNTKKRFSLGESWLTALEQNNHLLRREEITRANGGSDSVKEKQRESLKKICAKYQVEFLLPLKPRDILLGVILIGQRIDQKTFSSRDVRYIQQIQKGVTEIIDDLLHLHYVVRVKLEDEEARERALSMIKNQ